MNSPWQLTLQNQTQTVAWRGSSHPLLGARICLMTTWGLVSGCPPRRGCSSFMRMEEASVLGNGVGAKPPCPKCLL